MQEIDRFDEISSNWVNVHGFDDFVEFFFRSNLSKPNQLGVFDDFGDFVTWLWPKGLKKAYQGSDSIPFFMSNFKPS